MKNLYVREDLHESGFGGTTYYEDDDVRVVIGSGTEPRMAWVQFNVVRLNCLFGEREVDAWPSKQRSNYAFKTAVMASVKGLLTVGDFMDLLHEVHDHGVKHGRNELRSELSKLLHPEMGF